MNEILKKTIDSITTLPSKLRKRRYITTGALLFTLGGTYIHTPKTTNLTSNGVSVMDENGRWNETYRSHPLSEPVLPPFPYPDLPSDSIIMEGVPMLPDSFFEQKLHIEGQHPISLAIYGKWLCQLFANGRDIQDSLPTFMEGTASGINAEAICAAAACQFLLRTAGGMPNLTEKAQEFFQLSGKTSWKLPDLLQKVGYMSFSPDSVDINDLTAGDIIFARYAHSHYLSQTTSEHPGTHTIMYLGYQHFIIPHPCSNKTDINPVHILKARRQKQNDAHSYRDESDIQKLITNGEVKITIHNDESVEVYAPMIIHRFPRAGVVGGTSPRVRMAAQVFTAKKGGEYAFQATEYAHLANPSQFFAHPEVVDKDMPTRDIMSQVPTQGCLILKNGETVSHRKEELMSMFSLSETDRLYMLRYRKVITVRDAIRAYFPIPIPVLNDTTKETIQKMYERNYPEESNWSVNRSAIDSYVDDFNTYNKSIRSADPSTISQSGWVMSTIAPGMTQSSRCETLRSQISILSSDLQYKEYVDRDREKLSDNILWDARCQSAQLITADGAHCDIIIDHPEKIQAGTIYAWHLGSFLRSLHNIITSLSTTHTATIPPIDQIDPLIADVIKGVTHDADIQAMMATIHIRENNPSSWWMIGHKRKSAKVLRDRLSTDTFGDNSSGGRWQMSYSGFSHPSSVVDAIDHIRSLDLSHSWSALQQQEIDICDTLAHEAIDKPGDLVVKKKLSDYLREHIQTWTVPDESQMHRYLLEAALVAHNLQQNKTRLLSLIMILNATTHNQLSQDQQRVLDDLVCLMHNYGPTKVRQMMVINWLCRMIDETRLSYRTGVDRDLVLIAREDKQSRQRDNTVYRHYLSQIADHIDLCIDGDLNDNHIHITRPLQHIVDALEAGTEESLLDPAVQQAIQQFTQTDKYLDLHLNLSFLLTIGELYDQSEIFIFDPEMSGEGEKGSIKTVSRVHQPVITAMTSYLRQTPKDKRMLSLLLWTDGVLAILLLMQMVTMTYKAGRRTYRKIGKRGEMARIE